VGAAFQFFRIAFSKRAAVGQTVLWRAFRWGCYADRPDEILSSIAGCGVFPASFPMLKETSHPDFGR
jgi:hypothetical protein